ncbi:hypothetical protein [Tahibacter aquaticus]|uniref:hypothetical protein n=1 Tax=Tahibacter aquaticus TaxID=520092 RepID=UPI0014150645|nr:hypothetical protein [Tahibacter aquaticus]
MIVASTGGLSANASERLELMISRDGFEANGAQAQDAAAEDETTAVRSASGNE